MSYKSEESKVYQWLSSSWKESFVFRSEHNVGDIYSYMENINYFFDKDDKPIDRMEFLMYLIALLKSDEYGYSCVAVPVNGKKKVISVLINRKYDMRDDEYYNSERLCPDERYEFCFSDKSHCCQYRYVSKYIIRHGVKHYVIDCSLSIFKEKESIIKFCNALIGLFNNGEFRYDGLVANGYKHEYVKHKESQFSFGDVCTNGIEGFWSHFRRMIIGCYHNVSDEHLQAYIDEACFRWNTRKASQVERFLDMFFMSIGLVRPNREFVLCKDD